MMCQANEKITSLFQIHSVAKIAFRILKPLFASITEIQEIIFVSPKACEVQKREKHDV